MNKKFIVYFLFILIGISNSTYADSKKVYGRIWLSLNSSDNGLISTRKDNGSGLESYSSYLGFKGYEEIFNDYKFVYKIEITNTGGFYEDKKLFTPKNNYLGFSNDFGEVTFGRNDSVFKTTEGQVDLFNITSSDMSTMVSGNDRLYDVTTIYTKKFNGFKFGITYQLNSDYTGDDIAYALYYGDPTFKENMHYMAFAFSDGLNGIEAERFTYGAKVKNIRIGLIYQHSESIVYELLDGDSYVISMAYILQNGEIQGQYSKDGSGLGQIASQIVSKSKIKDYDGYISTIGYSHFLSKKITCNIFLSYTNNDVLTEVEDFSVSDRAANFSVKYLF